SAGGPARPGVANDSVRKPALEGPRDPNGRRGTRTTVSEGLSTTARRGGRRRDSILGQPRAGARGRPVSAPAPPLGGGLGATMRDTQADVPSASRPRAQLAFKDSMVHGILQFTPSIAFRYVLHRCESRDIRCRESFFARSEGSRAPRPVPGPMGRAPSLHGPWRVRRRGFVREPRRGTVRPLPTARRGARGGGAPPPPPVRGNWFAGRAAGQVSTMILPQVHLRKPCYDFSFL